MYRLTNFFYFLSFCVIVGFWAFVTPIFEFPDEQAHFATVDYFLANERIPAGEAFDLSAEMAGVEELLGTFRDPLGHNRYTYHPEFRLPVSGSTVGPSEAAILALNTPINRTTYVGIEAARYPKLYYQYVSRWVQLVSSSDLISRLFMARLSNLLLVFLYAFTVYYLGKLLFASSSLAATLSLLCFFQPMFSFVSAGVNSDNLHNLFFTIALFVGCYILRRSFNFPITVFGLFTVILDSMTKPQGYLAGLILGLAVFLKLIVTRRFRTLFGLSLLFFLILAFTSRIWQSYLFLTHDYPQSFVEYLRFSLHQLLAQNIVWYWGVFKWLGVVLPPLYWRLANRLVLFSCFGLLIYGYKFLKRQKLLVPPLLVFYLFFTSLLYALAIFWFDWQYTQAYGFSLGIQARYFFPTLPAHLTLLLLGILTLGWRPHITNFLGRVLAIFFLWLQLGGIVRLVQSYYSFDSFPGLTLVLSQYKPIYLKGEWWYLWLLIYLVSLFYISYRALRPNQTQLARSTPPSHSDFP